MRDDLLALLIVIAPLSLVAIGGASGIYARCSTRPSMSITG
jgi:hypothetical protein